MSNIWVFYDFETTGLEPQSCEIIQIGALAVSGGKRIASFQTLVKSTNIIPSKVVEITKITNEKLENAPDLENGWKLFWDWLLRLNPIVMIGHNSNKFDKLFLDHAILRFEHPISNQINKWKHLDTLEISKNPKFKLKPTNFKLISLIKYFNIDYDDANLHGALYDSLMTFKVFKAIIDSNSEETLNIWEDPSRI